MSTAVAVGSLSAVADGSRAALAESMMDIDALLVVDMSGSMANKDAPGGVSRYDAAEKELRSLQKSMPGRIGIIAFSSEATFCPDGVPPRMGRSTDMAAALRLALPMDDLAQIVLISDGCPDSESETLDVAARFQGKIDCIYIGSNEVSVWGGGGRAFLKTLAERTGGKSTQGESVGLFQHEVVKLLGAG